MVDETQKPPFTESFGKEGVAYLTDPVAARELAEIEDRAHDAVGIREAELERQHETGLTDVERENVKIMEGLKAAYPDAFEEGMDDKGRVCLHLRQQKLGGKEFNPDNANDILFSQYGAVWLYKNDGGTRRIPEGTNFGPVVDFLGTVRKMGGLAQSQVEYTLPAGSEKRFGVYVASWVDLVQFHAGLRERFKFIQAEQEGIKKESEARQGEVTAESILKLLV